MSRTIAGLFARSPFGPMQAHMEKVVACARMLPNLIAALKSGDQQAVRSQAKQISTAESAADEIKNQLRASLPSTVFLPVDRRDILEILAVQDAIADKTEDVGVLLTLRELSIPPEFGAHLDEFVDAVMKAVDLAEAVNKTLDTLMEASFGGPEAEEVVDLINQLGRAEHEADKVQDQLARILFSLDHLQTAELLLWTKVLEMMGSIADRAETMGNRLRLLIAA